MANKPLKILRIVTRLNVGGPAQHVVFLTEGLNHGQFQSKLTFGAIDSNEGDMSYVAQAKGIAVEEVACLRNGAGLLRNLQAVLQLYRLIRREKPNVVHLHLPAMAAAILRLLKDNILRRSMGERARLAVYPKYDVSRLIGDMENLYSKLRPRLVAAGSLI